MIKSGGLRHSALTFSRWRSFLLLVGVALWLAGCESSMVAPDTAPQFGVTQPDASCHLKVAERLPLMAWERHFVVPLSLNGRDVRFIVDTGAQATAITYELDKLLTLPVDRTRPYHTIGIGGDGDIGYPRIISNLKIGSTQALDVRVSVNDILTKWERTDPAAPGGLLGTDLLSQFEVEFDFPGRTMTLYRMEGCHGFFAPWQGDYVALPINPRAKQNDFVIPVKVDGHAIWAKLDTGATTTIITRKAAQAVGVDAAELDNDWRRSKMYSVTAAVDTRFHSFDSVAFVDTRYRHVMLGVIDEPLADSDILLGMDFLKYRRVWFSYGTGQVFFQRATTAIAPQSLPGSSPILLSPGARHPHTQPTSKFHIDSSKMPWSQDNAEMPSTGTSP
jgi:predicted aspartyl protease